MSASFYPARGCVYQVPGDAGGNGPGFYALEPKLTSQGSIILLQGVEQQLSDIIQPIVTLEDTKLIYTFGSNFQRISIYGEILLGPVGGSGAGASDVVSYFQTNRMSQKQSTIFISTPGSKAIAAYLQSLVVGKVDPQFHIQPFIFTALAADD